MVILCLFALLFETSCTKAQSDVHQDSQGTTRMIDHDSLKSNLSSFRIKQQLKNLNQRKQNLLNKKKDKEDDDLTIIY